MAISKELLIGGEKLVNRMGIGTWGFGGFMHKETREVEKEIFQINYMLEKGLNIVDCWARQAEGFTLELIREAIRGRKRNQLFLIAKIDATDISTSDDITRQTEKYLEELDVNYIDMLQICKPIYTSVSVRDVAFKLNECIDKGLAHFVGLSNAKISHIIEFQKYSRHPVESNEINYSLFYRDHEISMAFEYCIANHIPIIAYRVLGGGFIERATTAEPLRMLEKKYNRSTSQIALNWLLSKPDTICYITSKNPKHVDENLGAFDFIMEEEDYKRLDEWIPLINAEPKIVYS